MNRIMWLASYPKSGNTWFRAFYSNLIKDDEQPADINHLETDGIASSRHLFDEMSGLCSSDLTLNEIEQIRPGVYECISQEADDTIFIKVHDAYTMNNDGLPLIPLTSTQGALYFIRNPLDVAVSFAHHNACSIDEIIDRMADDHYAFCDNRNKLSNQLKQRLLSWSNHVNSWLNAAGIELQVIRYEDMVHRSQETFAKAVAFSGLADRRARIPKALNFSLISELQKQERENGFKEKNPKATSFFRKGGTGTWRGILNDFQVCRIINDHHDVMKRFGYLSASDEPVY